MSAKTSRSADRARALAMLARAYYQGRSGQTALVPQQGEFITRRGIRGAASPTSRRPLGASASVARGRAGGGTGRAPVAGGLGLGRGAPRAPGGLLVSVARRPARPPTLSPAPPEAPHSHLPSGLRGSNGLWHNVLRPISYSFTVLPQRQPWRMICDGSGRLPDCAPATEPAPTRPASSGTALHNKAER